MNISMQKTGFKVCDFVEQAALDSLRQAVERIGHVYDPNKIRMEDREKEVIYHYDLDPIESLCDDTCV